jgi:CubicO group peptidase (beta-lactamase class C family)
MPMIRRALLVAATVLSAVLPAGAKPFEDHPIQLAAAAGMRSLGDYNFEAAGDYAARNQGLSLIVMIDGTIVYERYDNGHDAAQPVHIASATKSFWGAAVAAMIDDGLLSGFDERVSDTIEEWRSDPRRRAITVRHLLSLSSGLRQDNPRTDPLRQEGTRGKYELAVQRPAIREPGTVFLYGPNHYYVLGELLKRKLAGRWDDPLAYLKQRILDPLGVRVAGWERDPSGDPNIPNGASITARDWVRFGQFTLQLGNWEGRQIVSAELMAELLEPSIANPGYGLTWWLNDPDGEGSLLQGKPASAPGSAGGFIYPDGLPDMAMAAGQGRNMLYVVPSLDMVVVRQATGETLQGFEGWEFFGLLLNGSIGTAPITQRESPVSASRGQRPTGRATRGGPSRSGTGGASGVDRDRLFDMLDRNGDGALSRGEIPDRAVMLSQNFDQLDRNRDGRLSPDELPGGTGTSRQTSRRNPAEAPSGTRGRQGGMRGSGPESADGDRVIRISPEGAQYIDPEFLDQGSLATFGERRNVWVARIDPRTGDFVVPGGQEWFIDSDLAPLGQTFSGPEFALDADGWSVIYDKLEPDGKIQVWQGTVVDGETLISPITSGEQHQTARASKDPNASSSRLLFIRGSWRSGTVAWVEEGQPSLEREIAPIETGVISASWIRGTREIVTSVRRGSGRGQIEILDTVSGVRRRVTNDSGDKTDPYAWKAPEYGGDTLALAIVDDREIAVYREGRGEYWDRIATLGIPSESRNRVIGSAEPFVVGDKSYVSLLIKNEKARIGQFEDGEVWIFDIEEDPDDRQPFRCDGGQRPVQRFDPEILVGEEAFVYYNVLTPDGVFEVWRCRSGLRPR